MLAAGLLGAVKGGASAVNTLSEERRKQLAEQLRMETIDLMEKNRQERGFKHAETLQGKGFEHAESMQGKGFEHAESMQGKGFEHAESMQGKGFAHAEGMQQKGFGHAESMQGGLFAKQAEQAKIEFGYRKELEELKARLDPENSREPPKTLIEEVWNISEKQAQDEAGGTIFGIGARPKGETYAATVEYYNQNMGRLGYGPSAYKTPRTGTETATPAGTTDKSPTVGAAQDLQPGGFDWSQYAQTAPGKPASAPAAQPSSNQRFDAAPQDDLYVKPTSGVLPEPDKLKGAVASADQAEPLLAGPSVPEAESTGVGVNPTKAMQTRMTGDPERKAAAHKEVMSLIEEVKKHLGSELVGVEPGDEQYAAHLVLKHVWEKLSAPRRAIWKTFSEFADEHQKEARKSLGLGK